MTESPELRPAGSSPGAVPRPWLHTVVTGGLLILWCGVIIFAIITWINPPWLAEMSRPGRKTEADWYSAAGVTRLRNNDFAGAISAFKQALAVNEDTQTRVHLAIAVARSGQVDAGVRLLEQALQENPGKFLRGVILFNIAEMIWRNPNNYEVAKDSIRSPGVRRRAGQSIPPFGGNSAVAKQAAGGAGCVREDAAGTARPDAAVSQHVAACHGGPQRGLDGRA